MSAFTVRPSDDGISGVNPPVLAQAIEDDTGQPVSPSTDPRGNDKKLQQFNLTQKISSLTTYHDPFKSLYRGDSGSQGILNTDTPQGEANSVSTLPPAITGSTAARVPDAKSPGSSEGEVTYINGKFQNLTLQRVLALRKVQSAIQYGPNPSAVGADSTSFSEDDLVALTMEELQALQKRKRDIGKEIQPLSVVKVSIQAERSKKRLEPRDYQIELYERARRENTIAVLGTGTGKTLIACLLIKDILVQERFNRVSGKKVYHIETQSING
jgi:hypothetical protein